MIRLYWTVYCRQERHAAIQLLEDLISRYGFIIDFKQFSDLSIGLIMEVPEQKSAALLETIGAHMQLGECDAPPAIPSDRDGSVFLHVTFAKGSGNLSIEVPAVG